MCYQNVIKMGGWLALWMLVHKDRADIKISGNAEKSAFTARNAAAQIYQLASYNCAGSSRAARKQRRQTCLKGKTTLVALGWLPSLLIAAMSAAILSFTHVGNT